MKAKFSTTYLGIILLMLFSCTDEEGAGPAATDTFIKFYGGANIDIASTALPTTDGGYILLGTSETENQGAASTFRIKLIKVDANGNTQWQKLYPSADNNPGEAETPNYKASSLVINDKGYLIIGDRIYSNQETGLLLLQTDLSGNEVMKHTINITEAEDTLSIHGIDLLVTTNGELKVTGLIEGASENIYLGTLNLQDLSEIPECTFRYSSAGADASVARSIIENNSEIAFAISMRVAVEDSRLIRVPACQGTPLGAILNSPDNENKPLNVNQITYGVTGYGMVGTTTGNGNDDIFLAKVNANGGGVQYLKTYSEISGLSMSDDETGLTITSTSDGGFIFGGSTLSHTGGETDIIIAKTDAFGNIVWSRMFGDQNEEYASFIQETPDGGYLIFGNSEFGGIATMVLIKTDENGDIN